MCKWSYLSDTQKDSSDGLYSFPPLVKVLSSSTFVLTTSVQQKKNQISLIATFTATKTYRNISGSVTPSKSSRNLPRNGATKFRDKLQKKILSWWHFLNLAVEMNPNRIAEIFRKWVNHPEIHLAWVVWKIRLWVIGQSATSKKNEINK